MPVFEPNEYFWNNHWDGKEEKWKAYARAMQQIMCDASGYKFSKNRIEDKFEYKKVIKGAKNQKFWRTTDQTSLKGRKKFTNLWKNL